MRIINNGHVHWKISTASTCPLYAAPVFLLYKNQVMDIFILNFFVKYIFVVVKQTSK